MDVDPVIPPVEGAGIVAKVSLLVGGKRGAEALDVGGFEDVIVVEDEGFEKGDEFHDFFELTFLAGKWRPGGERFRGAIDGLHYGFLRGGGDRFVARLGDGNGVEAEAHPLLDVGVRAIKFSVAEAGEFDRAAHVAGVGYGGG